MEENPTTDSSQFLHSDVRSRMTEPAYTATTSGKHSTTVPPAAREAAFHGPPRFDWIDIVSKVLLYACMHAGKVGSFMVLFDSCIIGMLFGGVL